MIRASDAAWAAIVAAHGHVQGKRLFMRAETLVIIQRERGDAKSWNITGRRLYGVPVITTALLKVGEVELR